MLETPRRKRPLRIHVRTDGVGVVDQREHGRTLVLKATILN
jgi:hypothetical protein